MTTRLVSLLMGWKLIESNWLGSGRDVRPPSSRRIKAARKKTIPIATKVILFAKLNRVNFMMSRTIKQKRKKDFGFTTTESSAPTDGECGCRRTWNEFPTGKMAPPLFTTSRYTKKKPCGGIPCNKSVVNSTHIKEKQVERNKHKVEFEFLRNIIPAILAMYPYKRTALCVWHVTLVIPPDLAMCTVVSLSFLLVSAGQ